LGLRIKRVLFHGGIAALNKARYIVCELQQDAPRSAKVEEHGTTVIVDDNVVGRDIAVQELGAMH
jgi:hypothetical protein